jgi:hypothetical protein
MDYKLKYEKYKLKYLTLKTQIEKINNQSGGSSNKKPELYLFKAEWCGHCKNFKDEWEKLKDDKKLNSKVEFITMDSDKNAKEIKEWKIEGFPTIILKKENNAI